MTSLGLYSCIISVKVCAEDKHDALLVLADQMSDIGMEAYVDYQLHGIREDMAPIGAAVGQTDGWGDGDAQYSEAH